MTAIEKHLAKVKADALKAGKTEAEVDALVAEEKARVEAMQAHPLFQGLAADNKTLIGERDTWNKEKAELTPLAAKAKELELAGKSELEKAAAKIAELEPGAKEAVALRATVKAIVDKRRESLPEKLRPLVPADDVAALGWFDTAAAAGILGDTPAPDSKIGGKPALGGGKALAAEELVGENVSVDAFLAGMKSINTGEKALAPLT